MKKNIFLILILLFNSACFEHYPGITCTVIDAETGKPIEGAVVLVEWTKKEYGIIDYNTESVKVVEVVTDKEGKFKVSGILRPFIDPPNMTIYKKGYVAWNNEAIFPDMKEREDFEWKDNSILKMSKFQESYSRKSHIRFIRDSINNELSYDKKAKLREAFAWEIYLSIKE